MRLLIVEDDRFLGEALKRGLELEGYAVRWIQRGDDLLAATTAEAYEVILLDLELPHMSGLDALRLLRDRRDLTPVVIITAQDRSEQKIAGLDAGADDYLVKPIDLDEVTARVRAQIRRRDKRSTNELVAGDIRLDLTGRTVSQGERAVLLTSKEYRILAMLMRRVRQFVSKTDIESEIYEDSADIESNTVEVAVSALRRKLGRNAIITARGLGYMIAS